MSYFIAFLFKHLKEHYLVHSSQLDKVPYEHDCHLIHLPTAYGETSTRAHRGRCVVEDNERMEGLEGKAKVTEDDEDDSSANETSGADACAES